MTKFRIHIGNDHAGFKLAGRLRQLLPPQGYEVVYHGPEAYDPEDDYPEYCVAAARAVVAEQAAGVSALGVVIGGSGNGEQIAANKVPGVRAALAWNVDTARLARQHNDANVLALGARMQGEELLIELTYVFLREPFSGDLRHRRRIAQVRAFECAEQP